MIAKIFEWAWVNGLDVRLASQSYAVPTLSDNYDFYPRREAPNYVDHGTMVAHMPVLIFSRGERSMQISSPNWATMMKHIEHKQKHIFAELALVPLETK